MIEPGAKAKLDQVMEAYKESLKLLGDLYRIALDAGVPEVVAVDLVHYQAANMGLTWQPCGWQAPEDT